VTVRVDLNWIQSQLQVSEVFHSLNIVEKDFSCKRKIENIQKLLVGNFDCHFHFQLFIFCNPTTMVNRYHRQFHHQSSCLIDDLKIGIVDE
jgi:hypothetical protein